MRFLFCEQVSETHLRGDTLDGSLSSLDHLTDLTSPSSPLTANKPQLPVSLVSQRGASHFSSRR